MTLNVLRSSFAVGLCLLGQPSQAAEAVIRGIAVTSGGSPIAQVSVSAHRGEDVLARTQTGADGSYGITVSAPIVDYVVYEHSAYLPRVVEGPLSTLSENRINVALLPVTTTTASNAALLGALHSTQYLQLIAKRDKTLPRTLALPDKLRVAMLCTEGPVTGGSHRGPEGMKPAAMWTRDDAFFGPDEDTSTRLETTPRP